MKKGYGFVRCKTCGGFTMDTWHGREYTQPCKECGTPMEITRQKIQYFKEFREKKQGGK